MPRTVIPPVHVSSSSGLLVSGKNSVGATRTRQKAPALSRSMPEPNSGPKLVITASGPWANGVADSARRFTPARVYRPY